MVLIKNSVSDLYSFDPDLAFLTEYRSDPDPIRVHDFDDQKFNKKLTAEKIFNTFFVQKLQFTYP